MGLTSYVRERQLHKIGKTTENDPEDQGGGSHLSVHRPPPQCRLQGIEPVKLHPTKVIDGGPFVTQETECPLRMRRRGQG
jgi:hypothetical protein